MRPQAIQITSEDILYAEKILLPLGKHFDRERRDFIVNLDTIDLQAVPGSGKTTALLAKLLILERYLPFENGSGILVIAHTNNAVKEITDKLRPHCPKLFSYPSFIGTIDSFVNTFLALPMYENLFHQKVSVIDADSYKLACSKFRLTNIRDFNYQENNNAKAFLLGNGELVNNLRFGYNEQGKLVLLRDLNGSELIIKRPNSKNDYSEQEKERIKKWIIMFKTKIWKDFNIIHYDDSYFLADHCLRNNPKLKKLLQLRFKMVFVDEMQDMESHQSHLIEEIFFKKHTIRHTYQLIGDYNQSIFTGGSGQIVAMWENNTRKTLTLTYSHRLSTEIAKIASKFALHQPDLMIDSSKTVGIKPHIIVFDKDTAGAVLAAYAELVKKFVDNGSIPCSEKSIFKAVAWRKNLGESAIKDERYTLSSFFEFNDITKKDKEDYPHALDYLRSAHSNNNGSLSGFYEIIIKIFIKFLRLEEIKDSSGKNYSKTSFFQKLKSDENFYLNFKLNLYRWTKAAFSGDYETCLNQITTYIASEEFITLFESQLTEKSADFFLTNPEEELTEDLTPNKVNIFEHNGIKIDIDTVHSVKGQTHTATLYFETFFRTVYESDLLPSFFGENHNLKPNQKNTKTKQKAMKMVYVGFSRPTHLLCFAVCKERFATMNAENKLDELWEVIDITSA